jgi:hypothetical protein
VNRAERIQGNVELIAQLAAALAQVVSVAGVIAGARRCRSSGSCTTARAR